ncbi:MAG: phospho-sugar mutase [Bacteroidales bacterium]|nr:phospho-sugar mutase [Bacteroidales bacterium]
METNYIEVAKQWLSADYDEATRNEVKRLMENDPKELEESFYKNLEFGTGGLRGIMGVGTNRMNKYTVGMATQGVANYLKENFKDLPQISVAVSFDSRNNSAEFAKITANVFAANGIKVYLFDSLRPVPELSYSIRHLKCQSGVMITASHNPKEYNGYKAYWEDGAQVTAPHDTNIINEVLKITSPAMVKFEGGEQNIQMVGADVDEAYLNDVSTLLVSPDSVKNHADMKMVYTPLHGTGITLVPKILSRMGFTNLSLVEAQVESNGNFPTVKSPNPEENSALEMAVALAEEKGADLVMATDPDADRVGIAIRDNEGKITLLNGNQTASILTYYLLRRWKELGKLNENTYIVKTIVTTELMAAMAKAFGVKCYNVLTGFKYIASIIRENEGKATFIGGGEESYGYNAGEFVRDKDAVITCALVAECAAWCADQGKTLYQLLGDIYSEFGFYKESLISLTKKGKAGLEEIQAMMKGYRENPPASIAGSPVVKVIDYNKPEETGLPKSNVLQFYTEDGSVVSVRPSGTEPKIKFYFGVHGADANEKVELLKAEFNK